MKKQTVYILSPAPLSERPPEPMSPADAFVSFLGFLVSSAVTLGFAILVILVAVGLWG